MSEEKELITELKSIVNQYNPMTKVYTAIALILIFVVGVALSIAIGEFWLCLIVIIGALVLNKLGLSVKSDAVPVQQLSYDACCIMEKLIYNKTHPREHSSMRANISTVGIGSHQELYQSFIQHYPSLASKKLCALACVTLKYEDFG